MKLTSWISNVTLVTLYLKELGQLSIKCCVFWTW